MTTKDLSIGQGNLAGKGVYAARDFKKGEVVIQYSLRALSDAEFRGLPESEKSFVHRHWNQYYLYSEPERYVNHSVSPNTYQDLRGQCDIAIRDIQQGEMVTTDASKDDVGNDDRSKPSRIF